MVIYVVYLESVADPRFKEGPIGPNRMYWWELVHWLYSIISIPILAIYAFFHAYKYKKTKWFIAMCIVWPLVFLYAWRQAKN